MKKTASRDASGLACPCGGNPRGLPYARCCGPCIEGVRPARTAHELMRSRYTAYVRGDAAYLLRTWHARTRPAELTLDAPGTPHGLRWLGLTVHVCQDDGPDRAVVRFTARYRETGRAARLQETSRFVREEGLWFYVDGDIA